MSNGDYAVGKAGPEAGQRHETHGGDDQDKLLGQQGVLAEIKQRDSGTSLVSLLV